MSGRLIGIGQLNWDGSERRSDRYGTVRLYDDASPSVGRMDGPVMNTAGLPGKKGRLVAEVIETRDSEHIGDLFRGIAPSRPEVGEVVVLGTGRFFVQHINGYRYVGLDPSDGRLSDWLDPHALYRVHQQTVRLSFEELDS